MTGKSKNGNLRLRFPSYNLEPETKFLTNGATISQMLADIERGAPFIPRPIRRDARTNIYYDTGAFRLYGIGFENRGRKATDGNGFRHDLKTPEDAKNGPIGPDKNGIFLRREYNSISKNSEPDLRAFKTGVIDKILGPIEDKNLVPWVKGNFTRKRFSFSPTGFDDSTVEIAFENGYYQTMNNRHRSDELWIVELELKEGRMAALIAAADVLKNRYNLSVCVKTKGEMGLEFARAFMDPKHQAKFDKATSKRKSRYSPLRRADGP